MESSFFMYVIIERINSCAGCQFLKSICADRHGFKIQAQVDVDVGCSFASLSLHQQRMVCSLLCGGSFV